MKEDIVYPPAFRDGFQTEDCFRKWLYMYTIDELKETLVLFESYEMFEDCAIILEVINEKK